MAKFTGYQIQRVNELQEADGRGWFEEYGEHVLDDPRWVRSCWGLYGREPDGFAQHIADRSDYAGAAELYTQLTGLEAPEAEPGEADNWAWELPGQVPVYVELQGGCVQNVYSRGALDVQVIDWDDVVECDGQPARDSYFEARDLTDEATAQEILRTTPRVW